MLNQIEVQGHKAIVSFDPDIGLLRGEFVGLNGGADFYADSVEQLLREAEHSLVTFLNVCQEKGIEPYQVTSGELVAQIPSRLHEQILIAAASAGQSFNEWVASALERQVLRSLSNIAQHCTTHARSS